MVKLNLNLTKHKCAMYSDTTCFSFYLCMCIRVHACVLTRLVHDNLHEHVCMSVTYMPNLFCMHVDEYMNCKPRMTVLTLWTCSCTKAWLWFKSWHKVQMPLRVSYCIAKGHIPYLGLCFYWLLPVILG